MKMIKDNFSPSLCDGLVITQYHIIGIKFDHFLKADHNEIDIISWEIEKFVEIFFLEGSGVHHITVPCYYVYTILFMGAVFEFLVFEDFAGNVILEILHA